MNLELIVVALISGIFTLMGISLLNHNWFKREDMKYTYYLKRQKQGQKKFVPSSPPVNPPSNPLNNLSGILEVAKNLDGDQIMSLLEYFKGGDEPPPSEFGELGGLLENPVIQNAIKGFLEGKTKNVAQTETEKSFQV